MWDIIKRGLIIFVYGAFIWYFVYLFTNGAVIVQDQYLNINILVYALLILFFVYKFVFYGFYPVVVIMHKPTLFVLSLILLFVGQYVLINNIESHIYVWDMMKLLAVVLLVLTPTNILHTSKTLADKKKKDVEIIEV